MCVRQNSGAKSLITLKLLCLVESTVDTAVMDSFGTFAPIIRLLSLLPSPIDTPRYIPVLGPVSTQL